jgi:dipeptidyl-peptidase-3
MADSGAELDAAIVDIMFDATADAKRVSLDASKDLILGSATNFYGEDITEKDVESFYKEKMANAGDRPVEFGLNSQLVKTRMEK